MQTDPPPRQDSTPVKLEDGPGFRNKHILIQDPFRDDEEDHRQCVDSGEVVGIANLSSSNLIGESDTTAGVDARRPSLVPTPSQIANPRSNSFSSQYPQRDTSGSRSTSDVQCTTLDSTSSLVSGKKPSHPETSSDLGSHETRPANSPDQPHNSSKFRIPKPLALNATRSENRLKCCHDTDNFASSPVGTSSSAPPRPLRRPPPLRTENNTPTSVVPARQTTGRDSPKSPREQLEDFLEAEDPQSSRGSLSKMHGTNSRIPLAKSSDDLKELKLGRTRAHTTNASSTTAKNQRSSSSSPPPSLFHAKAFVSQHRNASAPVPTAINTVSTSIGRSSPLSPRHFGPSMTPSPPQRTSQASHGPHTSSSRTEELSSMRTSSIDSAISSISSPLSHSHKLSADSVSSATSDVSNLIRAAGSPEALVQNLLREKHHIESRNAQLWTLVEKQRKLLFGLNQDLERATRDKERYRQQAKAIKEGKDAQPQNIQPAKPSPSPAPPNRSTTNASGAHDTSLVDAGIRAEPIPQQQASESLQSAQGKPANIKNESSGDESQSSSSQHHRDVEMTPKPLSPKPPVIASVGKGLVPSAPNILSSSKIPLAIPSALASTASNHAQKSSANSSRHKHRNTSSSDIGILDIPTPDALATSQSNSDDNSPEPPAIPPLHAGRASLAKNRANPTSESNTNEISKTRSQAAGIDDRAQRADSSVLTLETEQLQSNSDFDYDELMDDNLHESDQREQSQLLRTDGDQVDESQDDRHWTTKEKLHDTKRTLFPQRSSSQQMAEMELPGRSISASRQASGAIQPDSESTLTLQSKEGRLCNGDIASPPLSPNEHAAKTENDLSIRTRVAGQQNTIPPAPETPISNPPMSPFTSSNSQAYSGESAAAISAQPLANRKSASQELREMARPQGIFRGFVSEAFPDLLIPPNALPSIKITVISSRLKPSRHSIVFKSTDDEPVFTLGVSARYDQRDLWQVEKPIPSLLQLDTQLRQSGNFDVRLPDRSLFNGHAPARVDARKVALEQYFETVLETPMNDSTALVVCRYLSANAMEPLGPDARTSIYPASPVKPLTPNGLKTREGYLTKRGKNFGGWKSRYFVLDEPVMRYYEDIGGTLLGKISLFRAQIGRQSAPGSSSAGEESDSQYRHAFLIREPKRRDSTAYIDHVLCAESDRERDEWVDALMSFITFADRQARNQRPRLEKKDSYPLTSSESLPLSARLSPRKSTNKDAVQSAAPEPIRAIPYGDTRAAPLSRTQIQIGQESEQLPMTPSTPTLHASDKAFPVQNKAISGPQNGVKISDAGAWGNKSPASPASINQQQQSSQQKKRGIFGFHNAGNQSPSYQIHSSYSPLAASNSNASLNSPSHGGSSASKKSVFGLPLSEAAEYYPPKISSHVYLPAVVYRCLQFLEVRKAAGEEGIFRMSGSNTLIKNLRNRFDGEVDIDLLMERQWYDVHAIASLLKQYLRELPANILTKELLVQFLQVLEFQDKAQQPAAYNVLVHRLPKPNFHLLRALCRYLIIVVNNANVNKMDMRNIGIVFSPTLNVPTPVMLGFLTGYDTIFSPSIQGAGHPSDPLDTISTTNVIQQESSESLNSTPVPVQGNMEPLVGSNNKSSSADQLFGPAIQRGQVSEHRAEESSNAQVSSASENVLLPMNNPTRPDSTSDNAGHSSTTTLTTTPTHEAHDRLTSDLTTSASTKSSSPASASAPKYAISHMNRNQAPGMHSLTAKQARRESSMVIMPSSRQPQVEGKISLSALSEHGYLDEDRKFV